MKVLSGVLGLILKIVPLLAIAQAPNNYQVSLTEYGHPDFQGNWSVKSLTPLQRPDAFNGLVTSSEEAASYIEEFRFAVDGGGLEDPDFALQNIVNLDMINGELRTSVITVPEDGKIPYSENGRNEAAADFDRFLNKYDHPEQRPLYERCLGSVGFPPMRPFISDIPRSIVQTEDYFMLYTEDPGGSRIISLKETPPVKQAPSFAGTSHGFWEGNTLVIETVNFRNQYPGRLNFGVAVLVTEQSRVEERLTRISNERLLYQFTMTDPSMYSEPWRGEFTLQVSPDHTYEYSCHEGNYSLPGILVGGRLEQERRSEDNAIAQ